MIEPVRKYTICNVYDNNSNRIRAIHSNGLNQRWYYDDKNRAIKYIAENECYHKEIEHIYNDLMNTLIKKSSVGITDIIKFNDQGLVIREEKMFGYICNYEYDYNQNLIHKYCNKGAETWYTYENNKLVLVSNSLGYKAWFEYDNNGNLIQYKNSHGVLERYKYYPETNLLASTDNLLTGLSTSYHYTNNGKVSSITESNGKHILRIDIREYDDKDRLIIKRDNIYSRRYEYDDRDNIILYERRYS